MCGRFALFASGEELRERYPFVDPSLFEPRYNIAPTQSVAAVRSTAAGQELAFLRWGLIPSWSADPAIGNKLLNAR
jgi:putative SOS response-associated peptidase YedK